MIKFTAEWFRRALGLGASTQPCARAPAVDAPTATHCGTRKRACVAMGHLQRQIALVLLPTPLAAITGQQGDERAPEPYATHLETSTPVVVTTANNCVYF